MSNNTDNTLVPYDITDIPYFPKVPGIYEWMFLLLFFLTVYFLLKFKLFKFPFSKKKIFKNLIKDLDNLSNNNNSLTKSQILLNTKNIRSFFATYFNKDFLSLSASELIQSFENDSQMISILENVKGLEEEILKPTINLETARNSVTKLKILLESNKESIINNINI